MPPRRSHMSMDGRDLLLFSTGFGVLVRRPSRINPTAERDASPLHFCRFLAHRHRSGIHYLFMVVKPLQGSGTSSSLTCLVPRQVMLDYGIFLAATRGDEVAEKKTKKRRKADKGEEKRSSSAARGALLRAIATFLESGGFAKTLAAFQSEALLEIDEGSKTTPVLDLEKIICDYLELSKDPDIVSITGPVQHDPLEKPSVKDGDSIQDHSDEPVSKKKKKKGKGGFEDASMGSCTPDEVNIGSKGKRKEKNKSTSDLSCKVAEEPKTTLEEKERSKGSENGNFENSVGEDKSKNKDKKKRKHNLVAENSSGHTVNVINENKVDGEKVEKSATKHIDKDAKLSNQSPLDIVSINKKSKKRKTSASEEAELPLDDSAAVEEATIDLKEGKDKEVTDKLGDSLLNDELHRSRKKKKAEKNPEETANTPINKHNEVQKDADDTSANGNLGENENKENGSQKSKNGKVKHLAEPTTVNVFQRVKVEQVKFVDEKLKDNSYWAKDGAESGYGAKAQEVLGQVKGRDFRHEKTKKKRGSYRGGQIDFDSHSVKFKYSDDEE